MVDESLYLGSLPLRSTATLAALPAMSLIQFASFDRFAGEAAFLDALGEEVAAFVAPTELSDEAVPDVTLYLDHLP